MQHTTETFATLNTFETLSQQELMDVSGGDWLKNICKWSYMCPKTIVEGTWQMGLLS